VWFQAANDIWVGCGIKCSARAIGVRDYVSRPKLLRIYQLIPDLQCNTIADRKTGRESQRKSQVIVNRADFFPFLPCLSTIRIAKTQRLFSKGFGRVTVYEVTALLKAQNILDDFKFARLWVESRMRLRPRGDMLLRNELREKGIAGSVIEKVLSEKEGKEETSARELAAERFKTLEKLPKEKARKRLFDFLARRGFKFDTIKDIINEIYRD